MPIFHTPDRPHTGLRITYVGVRCQTGEHDECAGWWRYGPSDGELCGFRCDCPCHDPEEPAPPA